MPAEIRYSRVDRDIAMASDQAPRKSSLVRQLTALNSLPTLHPFMFHLNRTVSLLESWKASALLIFPTP